jgi:large subunit ribosomal protein L11
MIIKLLVDGGNMKPGPALSQKLGPLGINPNQVIQKVNESTKAFEGMKLPVEVNVNPSTKSFDIQVFSPPVSELLKKEFKLEKGSGSQKKIKIANASIEQIIAIAKTKSPNLLAKSLKSSVKTIAGTCVTLGILIENKPAKEIEKEIDEGKYDKEILAESVETPKSKREKLDKYFAEVKAAQDKILKQEAEAAAQKEAEAAAAAGAAGGTATPGAATTPAVAGTAPTAAKPEVKAKEEKKSKK